MKLLFCCDEYSGVDEFILQFQKVWNIFKPQTQFIVIDGKKKVRDFAIEFYPERGYNTLKAILQLEDLLGEFGTQHVVNQIIENTKRLRDEDDVLIVYNVFDQDVICQMGSFIQVNLKTTQEKKMENLLKMFPKYTPNGDLDKFLATYETPLEAPIEMNELSCLQLVQKFITPPQ